MEFLGYILAIGAAMTWGMVCTLDQKIMNKLSPMVLLFVSYIISLLVLLPLMFFEKGSFQSILQAGKTHLGLLFISTLLTVLASILILSSVKILNASTASVLEISYPIWVIVFSYFLYRSHISWQFILGTLLVFSGVAIIIRFR